MSQQDGYGVSKEVVYQLGGVDIDRQTDFDGTIKIPSQGERATVKEKTYKSVKGPRWSPGAKSARRFTSCI
jgi:hypothetical protein